MDTSLRRRHALSLIGAALAAATFAAPALAGHDNPRRGHLFTSTNAPAGNEVLVYEQQDGGAPSLESRVATAGVGTGAGLGSQGAVTLSRNGRFLFVVNAGSNSVSTFALGPHGIVPTSTVDSGGLMPTSVAERDGLVYVLNAGGSGNVAGFRNRQGTLEPLDDGVRPLSAAGGTAPAQVGFNREGDVLVVTERNTNLLTSFPVGPQGRLGAPVSTPSGNATPFGFAFARRDTLVVSEAAGGAALASTVSSYRFGERAPARPIGVSLAVPTGQTAACWVAVTPDGRYAYASNAGSNSVSSFFVAGTGALTRLQSVAGSTGANGGALDAAVSRDGQQLHVVASKALQIVSFEIDDDGSLRPLGAGGGLPAGAAGLAAN